MELWSSPFRPIGQSSPTSDLVCLVKSTFSTVCWPLVRISGCSGCIKHPQTLLWCGLMVSLLVRSVRTLYEWRPQLSHAQYFVQNMTHVVFWDVYCFSYLMHVQIGSLRYSIRYSPWLLQLTRIDQLALNKLVTSNTLTSLTLKANRFKLEKHTTTWITFYKLHIIKKCLYLSWS